jgi:Bacterial PH domain
MGLQHRSKEKTMAETTQSEPKILFDRQDQLQRVQAYVIPGETLVAVFDCKGAGTGFVGFTDQRLIFYDQAFLTKKKSMVSIPYNNIVGVASTDEGMIFTTSEITLLTAAGNYTFQFRGSDKAHMAYRYVMKQILSQAHPQLPG